MKVRAGIVISMSLFAGVTFHTAQAAPPEAKTEITWRSDLKKAHQESVKLNRPMMIVFGAEWCTYCRKMEQTTLTDPSLIQSVNQNYIPVHLDFDDERKVAEILEVDRLPCTVFLSPRADLLGRMVGFVGRRQYRDVVGKVQIVHDQLQQKQRSASIQTASVQKPVNRKETEDAKNSCSRNRSPGDSAPRPSVVKQASSANVEVQQAATTASASSAKSR